MDKKILEKKNKKKDEPIKNFIIITLVMFKYLQEF